MWQSTYTSPNTNANHMEFKNIYLGKDRLLTKLGNGLYHDKSDNSYQKENQYFNHANHIGSVNVISDSKGDAFRYIEYTPYGEQWFVEDNRMQGPVGVGVLEYGFTDHLHDEETGLIYANARYLDPKTSRWMSADPAMGEYLTADRDSAPAGGVFTPLNLQTYHYAGNNPLKYTDPNGKWIDPITKIKIIIVVVQATYIETTIASNGLKAKKMARKYSHSNGMNGRTHNNRADAYRHTLWNAMNARDVGSEAAELNATAIEIGVEEKAQKEVKIENDRRVKEGKPPMTREEATAFQKNSLERLKKEKFMDLYNNEIGRDNPNASNQELGEKVEEAIEKGHTVNDLEEAERMMQEMRDAGLDPNNASHVKEFAQRKIQERKEEEITD